MAKPNVLNPHPPEFERFLYASVGEDRNGYVVTVLSTLARLGLDPWTETAELVTLGRDAAQTRLGTLLARFRDVPTLANDHGTVARDLSQLLPEGRVSGSLKGGAATGANGRPGTSGCNLARSSRLSFCCFRCFVAGGWGSGQ
jgi:hypothetical protein